MKQLVAIAKNGQAVFLDDQHTHIMFHVLETPNLLELVREAVEATDITGDECIFEYDIGRIVGVTSLVETSPDDEIVYAKRKQRDEYSRFVKNRQPLPTRHVVVVVRRLGDVYTVWTAMCGRLLPADAYDPMSVFNTTHALTYDEQLIQIETITIDNPWQQTAA